MNSLQIVINRLVRTIDEISEPAVAVSGGIDSMTLAALAHKFEPGKVKMYHAVSPAVPTQATERVERVATEQCWNLTIFDAGEFRDQNYVSNPVNRCFYCKTNLYETISKKTNAVILSGANHDDLQDYRPGLLAADNFSVRHPFIENGIDKVTIRQIAKQVGLGELSELPASPCLSSRIETGISIDAKLLPLINKCEQLISTLIVPKPATVRCRVRDIGIVIELDGGAYHLLSEKRRSELQKEIEQIFGGLRSSENIFFKEYRMGSAFLHPESPNVARA